MAARNDVTGDAIQTRVTSETYRNNYDLIFRKNKNDTAAANHLAENTADSTGESTIDTAALSVSQPIDSAP